MNLLKASPRIRRILISLLLLYLFNKFYKKWKYRQKLFNNKKTCAVANKTILITGCDTGFGNATALKLSIKYGYKVIATCLKKESVDKFLSNSSFTENGSIATIMDVTKINDIERTKQFTIKYLAETNSILWGLVNNAGIAIPGTFELVPAEMDAFERNVLFNGPIQIIRKFLPLIHGRQNYKYLYKPSVNNGGRIVNVASAAARFIFPNTRYGPSKAALSYFSHALRMELSWRFGIWVCTIEPGAFRTPIMGQICVWGKRVENKLKETNSTELMDIYQFDVDKIERNLEKKFVEISSHETIDPVVDSIIHGLTAKYPQRSYQPGWPLFALVCLYLPMWMTEPIIRQFAI
eukprot:516110_1